MFEDTRLSHYILNDGKWMNVTWLNPIDLGDGHAIPGKWMCLTYDVTKPIEYNDCLQPFVNTEYNRQEAIEIALFFMDDSPLGGA